MDAIKQIEQLGGYEKAKDILNQLQAIPLHEQTEDTIVWLPDALYQYRRAHGIFEQFDPVVSTLDGHEQWKNVICTVKQVAYGALVITECGNECIYHHISECRHATDEEVKSKCRL